jgi:phage shock protein E
MQPIYLDVRTPAEFAEDHYPNAINHDVELLVAGQFPDASIVPRDAEIRVYCRSGNRSLFAQAVMSQAGYKNVKNVGGLDDLA